MRTLKEGDWGSTVELLQWGLGRAGENVAADGIFGPMTAKAVKRWQEQNGLDADGVAGPRTWASLYPYLVGIRIHTVWAGDTFAVLAARYGTTPEAIAVANPLVLPGRLIPGQTLRIPLNLPSVPTEIRWSSGLLELVVEGLRGRYPFLGVQSIGSSVLGRPLYQLTIGRGKIRVGYNAAHHANEWITTPVLLKFLEQYASGVAFGGHVGGADFRALYEHYTLDVVPMVNPDGVDVVTGGMDEGSPPYRQAQAIAAGFPHIPFPDGWKANIDGIDVNLSYPAGWEIAKRLKFKQGFDRPAPRDYVGPTPLAAPEAAAMARRTEQADYRLILAYHTQGKIIYWKYDDFDPTGAYALARRMGAVSGYSVETTPEYSGHAGYKDWFIQEFNRPGYTIEAGKGVSPLPLSQFDEIYRDNFGILLLGMVG